MAQSRGSGSEQLTPFALMIRNYMRENPTQPHLPAMTIPEFAELTGVTTQAVWNWLKDGTIPRPKTIDQIAAATGMSRRELYEAAGLEPQEDKPFDDLQRMVEREGRLSPAARSELLASIQDVRIRYSSDGEPTAPRTVWDYIYERASTAEELTPAQRREFVRHLREIQAEYTKSANGSTNIDPSASILDAS